MTPLAGFLPDVDPSTPGAIIECSNVIPFASGMKGAPTTVVVQDAPALASACRNAVVVTLLNGSRRVIAGTAAELYELSAGSWSTVSSATYTLGTDDRWSFAQFGDATIAATPTVGIQRSNGSGSFATISGAPQARVVASVSGFVLAFNTSTDEDRWACSALNDETDWDSANVLTTQANTGRLVGAPGPILAAQPFGSQVVAYKEASLWLGTYVGVPEVWRWEQVPGDDGCVGIDAVADIGPAHVFVSRGDIKVFDGTRPVSIANGQVRNWFNGRISQTYAYRCIVLYDKQADQVWIFYPTTGTTDGTPDEALVWHVGTKRWGLCTVGVQAALNYVSAGITWDTMPGTWDTLPDVSWDSQYWLSGGRLTTVFNTSNRLSSLSGATGSSSMTLFDIGDDQAVTSLKRVRVGYQSAPASATVTGFKRMSRGESLTAGGSGTYSAGKFDLRQTGRFHRLKVDATGSWSAAFVDFDLVPSGDR